MRVLIAFPIFIPLLILQTVVIRQIPLLQGSADLIMLTIIAWALQRRVETAWHWGVIGSLLLSLVSAIPIYVNLIGYLSVVGIAIYIRRKFWKISLVIMFIVTFLATLITQLLVIIYLQVIGTSLPIIDSINQVIIPSLLLNLLFAVPFYVWMSDLSGWLYPESLEA